QRMKNHKFPKDFVQDWPDSRFNAMRAAGEQAFRDHFDGSRPFHIRSAREGEGGLARACATEAA
ncbi:MAG TPA: hypothetical protein VF798_00895, partial [Burkholderiaceae bacterium]